MAMATAAAMVFFLGILGFAGWSIVESVRPRLGRIAFLLQYGPAIGSELPPRPRVTSRGRPVPARSLPHRMRAAA